MKLFVRRVTPAWMCVLALSIAGSALGATRYVTSGGGCGGQTPCYSSIQTAVDAASGGDTIKVATGTYTGSAPVMVGGITYDQVVIITKSLTVQGGYTTSDWATSDPAANLTTINAGGFGRCMTIVGSGTETVTVAGFTMTGGNYDNLGNPEGVSGEECARAGADCGGGFYASRVTLHLHDSVITGNTVGATKSGDGGGAYLLNTLTGTTIENTVFSSNEATYSGSSGGGVGVEHGADAIFSGCTFSSNQAYSGGGLWVQQPNNGITIEDTSFTGNSSPATGGGGIHASLVAAGTALKLDRVTMTSNQGAPWGAAAFYAAGFGNADMIVEMTNVIFANNTVSYPGVNYDPVVWVTPGGSGTTTLAARHLTFAGHSGMSAVRVSAWSNQPVNANLTNVLIETADNAFVGDETSTGELTIEHTNTMTNDVTNLHVTKDGTPTFTANNPLTGLPNLDPSWRLQAGSDAIDAGVDSGVTDDIDGEPRPLGGGFDIGADEYAKIFADGFESGSTGRWSSTVP